MAFTSQLSQERHANIFVWWPHSSPAELIACWDSSVVGPVTAEGVLRWVNMIAPEVAGGADVMEVRRVSLSEPTLHPLYHPEPQEKIESSDGLEPGYYGCYYLPDKKSQFKNRGSFFSSVEMVASMTELKEMFAKNTEQNIAAWTECLKRYFISDDLLAEASSGDANGKCVFTGYTHKNSQYRVKIDWIFPPGMARYRTHGPKVLTLEEFQNAQNLMMVRSDIYDLWHSNAFSVDVDDDYRIRIFHESATSFGLPASIDPGIYSAAEPFFREHFRFSLCANWSGGDPSDEHLEPPAAYDASDPYSCNVKEESDAADSEQVDLVSEVTARLEALQGGPRRA
ncbi:uncharacterized protein C8Q71DRAFT_859582 [Rhodofomes roseus]|uniref:HNH nuclease domain-containing protein n=1 Tax=Rhodofomes roseus TaxID=34475 RepID=A0ABQ8KB51_9APHY|nr:uncharacterized protein C8Q71DRAFT_859582 [Rhodofomes roseus]KAH9834612.1 hypothetical protein C8Q71DRAFT_859582 [Rhodofomes roseus]